MNPATIAKFKKAIASAKSKGQPVTEELIMAEFGPKAKIGVDLKAKLADHALHKKMQQFAKK